MIIMENIQRVDTFERQALSSAIQTELEQAASMLVKNRENLNRFEKDVAGQLPELKQMTEDAYCSAKATSSNFWMPPCAKRTGSTSGGTNRGSGIVGFG